MFSHKRSHDKPTESFSCNTCEKCFSRKDNMLQHIKLHEPKPHQCSHCKEFFSREFNLQRHIENNHKVLFPNGGTFVSEENVKAQCNVTLNI